MPQKSLSQKSENSSNLLRLRRVAGFVSGSCAFQPPRAPTHFRPRSPPEGTPGPGGAAASKKSHSLIESRSYILTRPSHALQYIRVMTDTKTGNADHASGHPNQRLRRSPSAERLSGAQAGARRQPASWRSTLPVASPSLQTPLAVFTGALYAGR